MTKKDFIDTNLEDILKLKNDGLTYKEIAKLYNTSASTIGRACRNNGNYFRPQHTQEDYDEIIRLYNDKYSVSELSKIFHMSEITIVNYLRDNNIHIRDISECKQIYTLNEHYFDEIDTQNKAYLLGWLWSDGHNCTSHNCVIISLQARDKEILELFNRELESNRPLRFIDYSQCKEYNRQNQYRLAITNRYMSQKLLSYGMQHDKSYSAEFPECVPPELYSHFIRGYMDGDGNIAKKECRMNITSTEKLCVYVRKIFSDKLNVHCSLCSRERWEGTPTRTLQVAGRHQVKKVLDYLYQDAENYLSRKYEIYKNRYVA